MIKFNKIGSDPEFFLVDKEGNPVPSFLFIEGSKHDPQVMEPGFSVLRDNLLAEGNIPPVDNKEEFIDNMKTLKRIINILASSGDAKITYADIMKYHPMWINTPDGQEFGCSMYMNAWTGKEVQTPMLEGDTRSAGMHIHISYDIVDKNCGINKTEFNRLIAKAMDYFVGIPSDQIFYSGERRKFYGALGSYRNTNYGGVEYRSLGGFFTQDKYLGWIYDQTMKAIDYCKEIHNIELLREIHSPDVKNYEILGINLEEQLIKIKEKELA